MKRVLCVLTALVAASAAMGADCVLTGQPGSNDLEKAANSLAAGQWCKLPTNVHNYAGGSPSYQDLWRTCGAGGSLGAFPKVYAISMVWDSSRREILWTGTGHNSTHAGAELFVRYNADTNTWFNEGGSWLSGRASGAGTCTPGPPAAAVSRGMLSGCNSQHSYDNQAWDGSRYYYHFAPLGLGDRIDRFDRQTATWTTGWGSVALGRTPAVAYWPSRDSLINIRMNDGSNIVEVLEFAPLSGTPTWTTRGTVPPSVHNQIEYIQATDEMWFALGDGDLRHYQIQDVGGTLQISANTNAASGYGFSVASGTKCAADPASAEAVLVCFEDNRTGGSVPASAWKEYNQTTDTWTDFSTLGISSMPPLNNHVNGNQDNLFAVVPDYGVIVYSVAYHPTSSNWGMYVYKHTSVECSDGIDNDGDGYIDLADGGCSSASDQTETALLVVPTAIATVTLKETSGVGVKQWPTRVVVPLPQTSPGPYTSTTNLRVYGETEGDNVGRCDVVLERDWQSSASPQPIRHVACDFRGTVAASGTRTYRIHSNAGAVGWGPPATENIGSGEGTGTITVDAGIVRFTVSETAFNIFDTVSYDLNGDGAHVSGEEIITSGATNGARLQFCASTTSCLSPTAQNDYDLAPDTITLEENSPMRAVIRAERYTRYTSQSNMQHGYVVRIYAWAGSPNVQVDYQLVNAATDDNGNTLRGGKWSDPFYFDSLNLSFNLDLNGTATVRTGTSGNGIATNTLDSHGVDLRYTRHDRYELRHEDEAVNYSACTDGAPANTTNECDTAGFMDLSDGTKGVQVMIRNMWETWPNGLQASDTTNYNIQAQLFPDWSGNYHLGTQKSVYWLDDMQAVVKQVMFRFHGANVGDVDGSGSYTTADLTAAARSFDRHPVPVIPLSHYKSTSVTFDLGGKLPATVDPGPGQGLLDVYTAAHFDPTNDTQYNFGWRKWAYMPLEYDRLRYSEEPGVGPADCAEFAGSGSPAFYWKCERWMWGEINSKPQWFGRDYSFAEDGAALALDDEPYVAGSPSTVTMHWRDNGDSAGDGGAYRTIDGESSGRFTEPREKAHAWFYHVGDFYWYSANPWAKDWLDWMAEYQRRWSVGLEDPNFPAVRGYGHIFHLMWQSYRVTGDAAILDEISGTWIPDFIWPNYLMLQCGELDPSWGSGTVSAHHELGYLMRTMGTIQREFKGYDWSNWAWTFQFLSALQEFNQFYYHFGGNRNAPGCVVRDTSSYGNWTAPDSTAYYYWITGKTRIKTLTDWYTDAGLACGATCTIGTDDPFECPNTYFDPDDRNWPIDVSPSGYSEQTWDGRRESRVWFYVDDETRSDTTPPSAISNLAIGLAGTTLTASFTRPAFTGSAPSYYLLVWADRMLEECTSGCSADAESTDTTNYRNWWAANPAATSDSLACSGSSCSIVVTGVTANPAYVAVFSFDTSDNMSSISNVAVSGCGDGSVTGSEQCDDGALNGTIASCCSATCQYKPNATACSDDGNVCTDDQCNATGTCTHPNNTDPCDDGQYCTATDTCSAGLCVGAGNPCAGHNTGPNCNDSCDEGTDACTANDTDGTACDDGLFCFDSILRDGSDTCSAGACTGGTSGATCDDSNICTDDSCNDTTDACVNALDPTNDPSCLQGSQCSGEFSLGPGP